MKHLHPWRIGTPPQHVPAARTHEPCQPPQGTTKHSHPPHVAFCPSQGLSAILSCIVLDPSVYLAFENPSAAGKTTARQPSSKCHQPLAGSGDELRLPLLSGALSTETCRSRLPHTGGVPVQNPAQGCPRTTSLSFKRSSDSPAPSVTATVTAHISSVQMRVKPRAVRYITQGHTAFELWKHTCAQALSAFYYDSTLEKSGSVACTV